MFNFLHKRKQRLTSQGAVMVVREKKPYGKYGIFSKMTAKPGGRGGQGVLQISSDRDDRMRVKMKTQKNPLGFQHNLKKIPGPKINPKKIPCKISEP